MQDFRKDRRKYYSDKIPVKSRYPPTKKFESARKGYKNKDYLSDNKVPELIEYTPRTAK